MAPFTVDIESFCSKFIILVVLKLMKMSKQPSKQIKSFVDGLDKRNYDDLKICVENRDSKKLVANLLEKDVDVKCPYCESKNYVKNGRRNDLQRYICRSCGKNYNILTGTPLARLRKKGHWLDYAGCLNEGLSIRKAADVVEVHRNTTFRWRHRFLTNAKNLQPNIFNGVVEAVESYFSYSEKGKKVPLHPEKIGEKVYVVYNRDRARNTIDDIVQEFNNEKLDESYKDVYPKDILFCSENNRVYRGFASKYKLRHGTLKIKEGELIKKDVVHINNVYTYKEDLYEWMSRFRGVATKYLKNYLSWYKELDEYNMNAPSEVLLLRAKSLDKYRYQPQTVPNTKKYSKLPPPL
jgi:transposase-like protein/ribosomal protein L20A (L18A)